MCARVPHEGGMKPRSTDQGELRALPSDINTRRWAGVRLLSACRGCGSGSRVDRGSFRWFKRAQSLFAEPDLGARARTLECSRAARSRASPFVFGSKVPGAGFVCVDVTMIGHVHAPDGARRRTIRLHPRLLRRSPPFPRHEEVGLSSKILGSDRESFWGLTIGAPEPLRAGAILRPEVSRTTLARAGVSGDDHDHGTARHDSRAPSLKSTLCAFPRLGGAGRLPAGSLSSSSRTVKQDNEVDSQPGLRRRRGTHLHRCSPRCPGETPRLDARDFRVGGDAGPG